MARVSFNVDAYTARLIGRENVSKLDGAVIELIKNTYDADASKCILYYDKNAQCVYLADNGVGMTEEIIKRHWMTIGRSSKKEVYITDKGRIQTGAKGIGRFALDRIADKCQMLTGTGNKQEKLLWTVDWTSFEGNKNITDVGAEIEETDMEYSDFFDTACNPAVRKLISNHWDTQGTVFKLTNLRDSWDANLIKEIRKNLASLVSYELNEVYRIYCFDNDTTEEEAEVFSNTDQFAYDYKVSFHVDYEKNQKGEFVSEFPDVVTLKLWRNEYDFGEKEDEILRAIDLADEKKYFHGTPIERKESFKKLLFGSGKEIENTIGSFGGTLYFSKLTTTKKDKERFFQKDITGREDLRDTFGGIKIYRDSFRVRPYGEANTSAYDWLQLARRKNASPSGVASKKGLWRVNADQMLGSVFISRINTMLPDQSNREGIVETPEFSLLKSFLIEIIQLLEEDRQYVCRKLAEYDNMKRPHQNVEEEIRTQAAQEEARREKESGKEPSQAADAGLNHTITYRIDPVAARALIDAKDEQIQELENEIKMLRTLATTGIVTNTYIHEFKTLTHKLNMKIIMAKEAIELYEDMQEAGEYINAANVIRESFNSWFQVTIDAVKKDKRRRRKVDLSQIIMSSVDSWNATLKIKNIKLIPELDLQKSFYIRCFPHEIETIINNLVANSSSAFDSVRSDDKRIVVKLSEDEDYIYIDYCDNGNGLTGKFKENPEKILAAFATDKRNAQGEIIGTGMGMWIVNNTAIDYNGKVDLSKNKTAQKGFYATISLKK